MECSQITAKLEELSPCFYAENWDNVGMLLGDKKRKISKIYVAVDATDKVVDEAILLGADMIITHHPLIFSPMKKITTEDFIGRRVLKMLENKICYYAMHTNFDVTHMAELAADKIGLTTRSVLEVTYEGETFKAGIGKVGLLPEEITLSKCAEQVKEKFDVEQVKIFGEPLHKVQTAAICPGSGKSVIDCAVKAGAQVLITGDIDHHEGIDAVAKGLTIIDAGHYGLEHIFVLYIVKYLEEECSGVEVIWEVKKNPFWYM
ncbi:MAG: Nif3-like dinuclear metal center hexameric protein [Lachnospiraceae bacterium]|nr:Nif3-like dinuclear metal center hexameric protein [Lachnospiraceae bacterium]